MDWLKHCPFCGGEGMPFKFGVVEEYGVKCGACKASTDDQFDSLEASVNSWNARAEVPYDLGAFLDVIDPLICGDGYDADVRAEKVAMGIAKLCGIRLVK